MSSKSSKRSNSNSSSNRRKSRPSPESAAHSIQSDASAEWEGEVKLTDYEIDFINGIIIKEYKELENNRKLLGIIVRVTEFFQNKVLPIGKTLISLGKKVRHSIQDSIAKATNPKLSDDIKTQDGVEKALAKLEILIFNDAFEYFTSEGKELSYDDVLKYIELGSVKERIKFAYTMHYRLQDREIPNGFNDSLAMMFIVHSMCQSEVDYTSTSYEESDIKEAIEKCTEMTPGTYLPEGEYAVNNSNAPKAQKPEYKYVNYLPNGPWWAVRLSDGKKRPVTNEEWAMLHQVKSNPFPVQPTVPHNIPAKPQRKSAKRRRKEQVPVQEQSKRTRRSTRKT
jgi:hypothetical protein